MPNKKPRISLPATRPTEFPQEEEDIGEDRNLDIEGTESDTSELKDETEQKLESLVFGDQAGFHDALKSYDQKSDIHPNVSHSRDFAGGHRGDEDSDSDGMNDALADLADDDVSFI